MISRKIVAVAACVVCLSTSISVAKVEKKLMQINASVFNNQGKVIGDAMFRQAKNGVEITALLHSLEPGMHGIHLHENADCSDLETFKLSGGHIMHDHKSHGLKHPEGPDAGDLPNLYVRKDGTALYYQVTPRVSLEKMSDLPAILDKNGSALVIHAKADDQISQPIGGSGPRIACAVLSR